MTWYCPRAPRPFWECILGRFLGSKYLLKRYLEQWYDEKKIELFLDQRWSHWSNISPVIIPSLKRLGWHQLEGWSWENSHWPYVKKASVMPDTCYYLPLKSLLSIRDNGVLDNGLLLQACYPYMSSLNAYGSQVGTNHLRKPCLGSLFGPSLGVDVPTEDDGQCTHSIIETVWGSWLLYWQTPGNKQNVRPNKPIGRVNIRTCEEAT